MFPDVSAHEAVTVIVPSPLEGLVVVQWLVSIGALVADQFQVTRTSVLFQPLSFAAGSWIGAATGAVVHGPTVIRIPALTRSVNRASDVLRTGRMPPSHGMVARYRPLTSTWPLDQPSVTRFASPRVTNEPSALTATTRCVTTWSPTDMSRTIPNSTFAGGGATTITSPREIAGSMEPPVIPTMRYQGLPAMPRSMNTIAASATTTATLTTMRRVRPTRPRRVRGASRSSEATAAVPRERLRIWVPIIGFGLAGDVSVVLASGTGARAARPPGHLAPGRGF